jgi:fermentation-respiration switch protein FrsA (DUF1100 family)
MFSLDRLFYHPTQTVYASPRQFALGFETVRFVTRDHVMLDAWFLPASAQPALGTVAYLHGNAGNITGHLSHVAWLPPAGWNLFCFDYRGYGKSEGRPSRAGLVADGHAALDYLRTRRDVDPRCVVVFGQSLGGAVGIVVVAERTDVAGVAVEGAFSDYQRIATWHMRRNPLLFPFSGLVPRLMMGDGCDPIDYVARISPRPLFIMHGREDDVVDPHMAEQLYATAREPKELWLIDGVGHYGALDELADEARPRLLRFFRSCLDHAPVTPAAGDRPHL